MGGNALLLLQHHRRLPQRDAPVSSHPFGQGSVVGEDERPDACLREGVANLAFALLPSRHGHGRLDGLAGSLCCGIQTDELHVGEVNLVDAVCHRRVGLQPQREELFDGLAALRVGIVAVRTCVQGGDAYQAGRGSYGRRDVNPLEAFRVQGEVIHILAPHSFRCHRDAIGHMQPHLELRIQVVRTVGIDVGLTDGQVGCGRAVGHHRGLAHPHLQRLCLCLHPSQQQECSE